MNRHLIVNLASIGALAVLAAILSFAPSARYPSGAETAEVAIGAFKLANFRLAERYFQQALARDPSNFRANYGYGLELVDQHRYRDALPYLLQAVKANPTDENARLTLGALYQDSMNLSAASGVYQALLAQDPNNTKVLNNLGLLEIDMRDYAQARAHLKQYLKLAPKAPDREVVAAKLRRLAQVLSSVKKSS